MANKLIGQFAERLEADLLTGSTSVSTNVSPTAEAPRAPTAALRTHDAASINLLSVVAGPVAKRVLPVVGALAVGVAIGYVLGRRR